MTIGILFALFIAILVFGFFKVSVHAAASEPFARDPHKGAPTQFRIEQASYTGLSGLVKTTATVLTYQASVSCLGKRALRKENKLAHLRVHGFNLSVPVPVHDDKMLIHSLAKNSFSDLLSWH